MHIQRQSLSLGILFAVGVVAAASTLTPGTQKGDPEVGFMLRVDLTPLLALVCEGHYWLGHLNDDGDFVPDYENPPQGHRLNRGISDGPHFTFLNGLFLSWEKVYEFRAGRLIEGVLRNDHAFVPEFGSRVIALKDYHYSDPKLLWGPSNGALRIYNLPGWLVTSKNPHAGKPPPVTPVSARADATTYGGIVDAPAGYDFQEDVKPLLALVRGYRFWLGHLNRDGDFVPDFDNPTAGFRIKHTPAGLPAFTYLNKPSRDEEPVYEYRSGRLIKGVLWEDGTFVPELGSQVIGLKEYRPGTGLPRIYNLPGRLVPKKAGPAPPAKP